MLLYVVCVIYNDHLEKSVSWKSFQSIMAENENVRVIIVDNSTGEEFIRSNQEQTANSDKVRYICNNGNLGLSKSYNKAISSIDDDEYWVMLSDDDTEFGIDYLRNVCTEIENSDASVLTGIIKTSDGTVISPMMNNPVLSSKKPVTDTGMHDNIFCINSGLVIKSDVLKAVGPFSEELFLDMIDYWFMDTLAEKKMNRIKVLEGAVSQNFSGAEGFNENTMKRYDIYKADFKTYCRLTHKTPFYRLILLKRRINLARLKMRTR